MKARSTSLSLNNTDERGLFLKYLPGYTIEMSSPVFYSPSNDGLTEGYDLGWSKAIDSYFLIGYTYYAGYPYDSVWVAKVQPRRANQKASNWLAKTWNAVRKRAGVDIQLRDFRSGFINVADDHFSPGTPVRSQ